MRKLFSLFAALTLSVGLWAETVAYRYPTYIDGDVTKGIDMWQTSSKEAAPVTSTSSTWGAAGQETWLVVNEDVTISERVTCNGDVRLILADGVTLNAQKGITVSGEGNFLTIYAQTEDITQMGKLIAGATNVIDAAGIGGGVDGFGSNITINGGIITANGGSAAAGIGGGNGGYGSNITINGGIITAVGLSGGAGIGGGMMGSGSNITILAGTVTATSGGSVAGIGGGMYGDGSNITINGGEVTATGGEYGSGIGGGVFGDGSNITINGGEVTATGRDGGAGIGGGNDGLGSNITINGGTITATSAQQGAGIGGGVFAGGSNITINGGEVTATGGEMAAGIGGGEEANGSNITINGGTVTANGGDDAAGIGGGAGGGSGSNITINGGVVTATGGDEAAGIGGGSEANGSNITINGGTVTATSKYGAGIGGGFDGSGSNITINGGTITATGKYGAGIGGGNEYEGDVASNIYISDAYILKAGTSVTLTDADIKAHSSATDLASTLTQPYVKIEGLATPYTRSMTIDNWATVCLPYAATSFEGADFYKVNYYDDSDPSDLKLYIEPVDNLVAGMPYIFQATADVVTINHSATAPEAVTASNENGLYGSFARKTIAYDGAYAYAAIAGGAVNVVEEGYNITIPACRAYLDMDEVPTVEQPHSAPLRCMGAPRGQATDLETVDNAQCTMHDGKFLRNGQFIIVREGKIFNAQGMEVK